jgi:MFS family permease
VHRTKLSPLFVIFLTVFIDLLGFGIVIPLLPRYAAHFQASDASIGLLMSSFSAMQFLFAPLWGRLSDRVGRRPVLLMGLLSSAVFYGLFSYATWVGHLWLIFVARIGAGIAGATIPTAQAYIADTTSGPERGRGMALIGAAFGIGFTFGPLLGSFWVSDDPSAAPGAAPGLVAALLSLAAFCLAVAILPESLDKGVAQTPHRWFEFARFKAALQVPTIALLLATFFTATFAFSTFEGTLPRITKDAFGFSDRHNFYLFAYVGLLLSLAQGLFVRRMVSVLGEVFLTGLGTVLMGAGLLGIGMAAEQQSAVMIMLVLPIAVLGFASLTPSVQSLISRRSATSVQGGVLGVAQSVSSLARIFGPFLGNVLYGATSTHTLPYFVGAGLMGVAFLLSLGLARAP